MASAQAYRERGIAYQAKGKYDNALADFTKAIRLNPKDARLYLLRKAIYWETGELDKCWADLMEACRLDPKVRAAFDVLRRSLPGKRRRRQGDRQLHGGHAP